MSLEFSDKELEAIRKEYCKGFTDSQFDLAMAFCRIRNLIPGKHVVFQIRTNWEWDDETNARVSTQRVVFITTIDAARLIAQRSGEYAGQGPEEYIYLDKDNLPTIKSDIPLPQPNNKQLPLEPWAVRTTVYRKGFAHPITSVARFDAYAVTRRLKDKSLVLTDMWSRRSPEMLAKCSEMLSLRKGYPEELGQIFIREEFQPEPQEETFTPASVTAASDPDVPSVPAVNQTPVEGTEAPRPNEVAPEATKPPTKRGRKPKESPENGQPVNPEDPSQLSAEDLAQLDNTPAPAIDTNDAKQEAEQFVESLDPTPTQEEMNGFVARVRALVTAGANRDDLKTYILAEGKKDDTKKLTVANWKQALEKLETAQKEGKLAETVKPVPVA